MRQPAVRARRAIRDRNVLLVTIDTLRADALGSYGGRAVTPNLDRLAAARRALQLRARARRRHAAVAREHPQRPISVRARHPRQHRLSLRPEAADAGDAAQGRGVSRPAPSSAGSRSIALRPGRRLRRLRRSARRAAPAASRASASGRADAVVDVGARLDRRAAGQVVRVGPRLRSARALRAAGRVGGAVPVGSVPRRSVVDRRALGAAVRSARGQPRPTLVVVTADHGESLGDHGELTHSLFAYEATLRVPLIVAETRRRRRRERQAAGVVDTPARHVDLLPTILDAAGVSRPTPVRRVAAGRHRAAAAVTTGRRTSRR